MRGLDARVVLHGRDFDEAKEEARRVARESGGRFVEDGLDVETAEGADRGFPPKGGSYRKYNL